MRRILSATCLAVLATTFAPTLVPAHAGDNVNLGYETWNDGDEEGADMALDFVTETLVAEGVGPVSSKCVPKSNVPKQATILFRDAAGLPTFALHHDITFSYNCKTVTRLSHSPWYEIFQPQYSFQGYLVNSVSPAGQKKATASAQGRFGICVAVAGSVCALERDPSIVWHVDFTGKAYAKTTP